MEIFSQVSKTKLWVLTICLILAIGMGSWHFFFPSSSSKHSLFKMAPSFQLKDSKDNPFNLNSIKGSIVIVHFWAAWCAPCIPELPEVIAFARKIQKIENTTKIYWVLISQDENWEQAHRILDEEKLPPNFISLLDPEAKVSAQFGTYQFPETYLISKKGEILKKWVGPQEWNSSESDSTDELIRSLIL